MKNINFFLLSVLLAGSTISSGYCAIEPLSNKANRSFDFQTETETISQIERDQRGFALLHWAAIMENKNLAEKLLVDGIPVNIRTDLGCTPLFLATQRGREENVIFFISSGADVNATNDDGETPLHAAAKNGHTDIAKILLENGAFVYKRNVNGLTPLHIAVCSKDLETIRMLLNFGADVNKADKDGNTPLHFAAMLGDKEILETLLLSNANPNTQNSKGYTPHEIIEILAQFRTETQPQESNWFWPCSIQ